MANPSKSRGGESYWTIRRRIRAEIISENVPSTDQFANAFDELANAEMLNPGTYENSLNDFDDNFENHIVSSEESDVLSDVDSFETGIGTKLADWATSFNITHTSLSSLLSILNKYHPELPLDPRTLLRTPKTYLIRNLDTGGEMCYFGINKGIQRLADNGILSCLQQTDVIQLQFNIDGLPLFKSSNMQLWPILCLVKLKYVHKPFVVAAFCGTKKPGDLNDFCADFVNELKELQQNGIDLNGNLHTVAIHSFVCDAPARAFLKNIKLHSGYSSCERCTQEGEWFGRVVFLESNCPLHTSESFVEMVDDNHHLGSTPLITLSMDCISDFVLDYMHLLCLGVTRKMLKCWLSGPLTVRVAARTGQEISTKLLGLSAFIPKEFVRKQRSLQEIDRWKATEFRLFLLYTGIVVLKGYLKDELYNNFVLLFVASSILLKPDRASDELYEYADTLLKLFVKDLQALYGQTMCVYNVHGLTHLSSDAKKFGSLDSVSAFPFENELKSLKRLIRKPQNPLSQLCRRLFEIEKFSKKAEETANIPITRRQHFDGPLNIECVNVLQFKELKLEKFFLSVVDGNNCIFSTTHGPCLIKNIVRIEGVVHLIVEIFEVVNDFFNYPMPSSKIHVYNVSKPSRNLALIPITDILHKCVCLPYTNSAIASFILIPLLHSM